MDDAIDHLLALLSHWRVLLCLAASALGAAAFVHVFPWFTGLQGIVLGALGFLPGAIWESRAEVSPLTSSSRPTARPFWAVCVLSLIVGATWGAASAETLPSFLAGLGVLVVAACTWCWYVARIRMTLSMWRALLCTASALAAYAVTAWQAHP